MTRAGDVVIPDVVPHPPDPGAPLDRWRPWRPVFALELLPQAAYVWDDADPAVVWDEPGAVTADGYLHGGVTVTTPDPGVLPGAFVIVERVRYVAADMTGFPTAAGQAEAPDPRSWQCYRTPGTNGRWYFPVTTDGIWANRQQRFVDAPVPTVAVDQTAAVAVSQSTGGRHVMTSWTYDDATATWTQRTTRDTGVAAVAFDVTTALRVGGSFATGARVYSVELRTGTDPRAGTVVWRFDANDYPGTGTTYVDPRGRTWTLSAAGAITPAVRGEPPYVWDAPFIGGGFTDVACDWMAFDVDPGDPDELFLFPAVSATLTLANADGAYTVWSADGRLVYWAPGRRLAAYWLNVDTDEERWLFSGRVASWTANPDGTVTVVAYDGLAALAQPVGPWIPGAPGDTPGERITAITAAAEYPDPVTVDVGAVTLSTAATTDAPLDLIEVAALSDGGLFYGDADGAVVYRDRGWRSGRGDQSTVWTVSDNVCTVPVVVWDPEAAADDDRLATYVRLANAAGLIAVAAAPPNVWSAGARWVLTHPDPDQWETQQQGDDLAAYLIAQQSTPSMAVAGFDLYGLDPRQPVADLATDLRRGDILNVVHDFTDAAGQPAMLDLFAIVLGVAHNLTPDQWLSHVQLSRTVDYRLLELWDRTVYVWDQDDPNNVWRF